MNIETFLKQKTKIPLNFGNFNNNEYLKHTSVHELPFQTIQKHTGGRGLAYMDGKDIFVPEAIDEQNIITTKVKDKNLESSYITTAFILHETAHFFEDAPAQFIRKIYYKIKAEVVKNGMKDENEILKLMKDEIESKFKKQFGKSLKFDDYQSYYQILLQRDIKKSQKVHSLYNSFVDIYIENLIPLLRETKENFRHTKFLLTFLRKNLVQEKVKTLIEHQSKMSIPDILEMKAQVFIDPRTRKVFEEEQFFNDKDWEDYFEINKKHLNKLYEINVKLKNTKYGEFDKFYQKDKDLYSIFSNKAALEIFNNMYLNNEENQEQKNENQKEKEENQSNDNSSENRESEEQNNDNSSENGESEEQSNDSSSENGEGEEQSNDDSSENGEGEEQSNDDSSENGEGEEQSNDNSSENGEGEEQSNDDSSENGEGEEQSNDDSSENGEGEEQSNDNSSENGEGEEQSNDNSSENSEGGKQSSDSSSQNGEGGEQSNDKSSQNGEGGEQSSDSSSQNGESGEQSNDSSSENGESGKQSNDNSSENDQDSLTESQKELKKEFQNELNKETNEQEAIKKMFEDMDESDIKEAIEKAVEEAQEELEKQNNSSMGKSNIPDQREKNQPQQRAKTKNNENYDNDEKVNNFKSNPGADKRNNYLDHISDREDLQKIILEFEEYLKKEPTLRKLMKEVKKLLENAHTKERKSMNSGNKRKMLKRAIKGDVKVFNKYMTFEIGDISIFVLYDNSGSMSASVSGSSNPFIRTRKDYALLMSYLIKRIFEPLNANVDIKSFTNSWGGNNSGLDRNTLIEYEDIQKINSNNKDKKDSYYNIAARKNNSGGGTNLLARFIETVREIKQHQHKTGDPVLLFTISDGDTSVDSDKELAYAKQLNDQIENDKTIKHIKLCIDNDAITKYFGATVNQKRYIQESRGVFIRHSHNNKEKVGNNLKVRKDQVYIDGQLIGTSNDFRHVTNTEDLGTFFYQNLKSMFDIVKRNGKQVISNQKSKTTLVDSRQITPF